MNYLDTNIIIYAIENDEKYGKSCKKILTDIQKNNLKACCSIIVLVEVINVLVKINKILKKENKEELNIRKNIDSILSLPIVWFDLNFFVIKKASEYDYKISGVDYIHISTMELNSIKKVLSADAELDKIETIKRIDPLKY